jgi:hypothetical protein
LLGQVKLFRRYTRTAQDATLGLIVTGSSLESAMAFCKTSKRSYTKYLVQQKLNSVEAGNLKLMFK